MEKKSSFKNNQIETAGILFLQDNFDKNKKYPSTTIYDAAEAVKGQSPSLYGKKIAQREFITLAFDTFNQGESGELRYLKNLTERAENIHCAVEESDSYDLYGF
ncbi:hypothetical protein [Methanobacterium sp. MBAC-LM]|uniref:hypothetical protein n=1 Tax=Methanobacterium sp. MBAC-LM TaxID=3412034 RepID=UPI003C70AF37